MSDLWVFGYGSLMWRPGFAYEEAFIGELQGYQRSLCIYSHRYRGTAECPGLVLGLDEGGHSQGMVFRVKDEKREEVMAYLRDREQVTMVYIETLGSVKILNGSDSNEGRVVEAVVYVADHTHDQYAGKLSLEEQTRIVRKGHGQAGPNTEYVLNTVDHLREMNIDDEDLFKLADRLRSEDAG